MKQFGKIFFAVAIAAVVLTPAAFAQTSATASNVPATATIVPGITIAQVTGLAFGDMLSPAGAGTVTVDTAGARTSAGVTLAGGTFNAATFDITGGANKTFSITLPAAAVTLTSGGNTMTVDTFASNPTPTGTITGGGTATLAVGATLNVGAAQAQGTYNGVFDVTVAYN
ncbi:MAG: DUF4402 domain-containing protein [Thermoanaerobaculia bacterium]